MLEYCFEFEPTVEKTGIRTNTGRPTSRLLHSLYNIILRLASIRQSIFTYITQPLQTTKITRISTQKDQKDTKHLG